MQRSRGTNSARVNRRCGLWKTVRWSTGRNGLFILAILVGWAVILGCAPSHRHGADGTGRSRASGRYHCPMHPSYVSDRPGDCPICNMALVPVGEMDHAIGAEVPGRTAVNLTPEKRHLIGVMTATAERRRLATVMRTVGRVEYAEPRVTVVNTKVGGWIEKLYVNTTGQFVRKGEPLLELFSPELVTAQREFLLATGDLRNAMRQRFELWDITAEQIAALERRGAASRTLTIVSPRDGYVVVRNAVAGKAVAAGEELYQIADLSTVWVVADVYERDVGQVRVGQRVQVTARAAIGEPKTGEIQYVYPYWEAATQTGKIRVELENAMLQFKPGMYVDVEVELDGAEVLAVPASAVLDTGPRQLVFVDAGEGWLEPREVQVGLRTEDWWEVREGVAEGERVVTRALFLVDSESQLKAAVAGMTHAH